MTPTDNSAVAPWSLARRLSSALTLALAVLWLVAVLAAAAVVRHEINEVFDSALQENAERLLALMAADAGGDGGDRSLRVVPGSGQDGLHEEYVIYQLRDKDGRVLLRSHKAPEAPLPLPLTRGLAETDEWRYFTDTDAASGLVIHFGDSLAHRREAIYETLAGLVAPLALLVPLAGLIIFWTVRRALTPLAAVRAALDARGGGDLSPIPQETMPLELAPIIADVNRLLARLEHVLASERAFAANSAHELRTPVAAALAQTQRLAAELEGVPQRQRADQIAATLRRLGDLVEKLLQLARAEAGIALGRNVVDLLPALRLVVEEFQRHSTVGDRLSFDAGGREYLAARIDIDAFGIVLRNLIDNALHHGSEQGAVAVHLDGAGAIHVVNDGPVVRPDSLLHLTERFERAGASTPGIGLGLAIVDSIMAQAGGSLTLHSPARGRRDGFEAVLRLDLSERAEVQPPA